jgi:CBS domain-containing protein
MEHPRVPVARELMAAHLVSLTPEMSIVEAAEILVRNEISGAPVVDADGHLIGMITEFDCLQAVASAEYQMDRHDTAETVRDLMTDVRHTVAPDVDLYGVAHELVSNRVRRLPVVENGQLVGQVSRRDVLKAAIEIRRALRKVHSHYPDYPEGRDPIRDYPRQK